jgi:diguanylate cyclase (GGDEF)-like protein
VTAHLRRPFGQDTGRFFLIVTLTALAYYLAARLGFVFSTYFEGIVAAVWLAAGVAAAASLRFGYAAVLGVLLGAFAANSLNLPAEGALTLGLGAAAGAWIMGCLPRYFPPFSPLLDSVSSVTKFALVAVPLGCAVSALVGLSSLHYFHHLPMEGAVHGFWIWWLADILGVFLLAPLLVSLQNWERFPAGRLARVEGALLIIGMLVMTWMMLLYTQPVRPVEIVLFVLIPSVLWAAVRFSLIGVSVAIFLAAVLAVSVMVALHGGIDASVPGREVFALQASLITMALGGLFVASALAERRYSEMRLDMLANHDPLTGLPNRSYFQDQLGHALARAQRDHSQVSLLFIDLDRFKNINDSQGHEVGDQVLRVVASRLDDALRLDDFVARLGGDEFAVIMTHPPSPRAASRVARKLSQALSEPFSLGQRRYAIGASIGISVYPDDGSDAHTLLRQADLAMYQAKQRKTGHEFFSADMNAAAHEQLQMETGLRRALAQDELVLLYQPKLDLASNRVVGLEALIRWIPRPGKMIRPDKFIPVAEETGLIVPIGRWVIREACSQWVRWNEAGLNPPGVAVNLSARQFGDMSLLDDIDAALKETGMNPAMLHIELTESAAMDDPERTLEILKAMRSRDLHLSIDDFGTGHSNLSQLKRLPIDALKIDKSFVNDVLTDSEDAEITTAIIRLAHALSLRVVAEGVETEEQLAYLRMLKCDEIQGYVLSQPLPPENVEAFFSRQFDFQEPGGAALNETDRK